VRLVVGGQDREGPLDLFQARHDAVERARADRLGGEPHGAILLRGLGGAPAGVGRDHEDDGTGIIAADRVQHLQPVQPRHVDVEQNEVESAPPVGRDGVGAVVHFGELESRARPDEVALDEGAHGPAVVGQQDMNRGWKLHDSLALSSKIWTVKI
jgi:hypothetical protein